PAPAPTAGATVYQLQCAVCHNAAGEGIANLFPPLAASDYLVADKARSIRIVLEGLSGPIKVNGADHNNVMPAAGASLDDDQVAAVLTHVRASWGNHGDTVTPAEVARVRATLAPTGGGPQKADPFAPLPAAPAGFRLRDLAHLPAKTIRFVTAPGAGWLILLGEKGDLYRLDLATAAITHLLAAKDYADVAAGTFAPLGLTIDSARRLYVVTNQQVPATPHHLNRVIIFRSAPLDATGTPAQLKPWFQTSYPWGNNYYNHGVGNIAEGPDGLMYVTSGSRTDGGEVNGGVAGQASIYWKGAETEITAALWRLDPKSEKPALEVFARGIRNAWTFAWNDRGELFSASNGPDANVPEELDFVERGKHYGFPYQYGEAPATAGHPYPYTQAAPAGLTFTPALRNLGPAAGGSPEKPMASFEPHSSPAGMIFCGPDWPEAYRGKFLLGRFGNFITQPDVGYDLLTLDLKKNAAGIYESRTETFLAPLARPIDLLQVGKKLYILEYTRPIGTQTGRPMTPGRILELSW
ncbi:MAG: PQQ-dependent sugar dehydrogenase, partial [Undibacterium sp.]|nr:PQQ-dependent sugar dehydrogenase [Opitutaceae bacterium]